MIIYIDHDAFIAHHIAEHLYKSEKFTLTLLSIEALTYEYEHHIRDTLMQAIMRTYPPGNAVCMYYERTSFMVICTCNATTSTAAKRLDNLIAFLGKHNIRSDVYSTFYEPAKEGDNNLISIERGIENSKLLLSVKPIKEKQEHHDALMYVSKQ